MVSALLNLKISIEDIEAEFEAANQAEFEAEIEAECEAFKASAIVVPEGTAVPEANTEPASSSTIYVPLRFASLPLFFAHEIDHPAICSAKMGGEWFL